MDCNAAMLQPLQDELKGTKREERTLHAPTPFTYLLGVKGLSEGGIVNPDLLAVAHHPFRYLHYPPSSSLAW